MEEVKTDDTAADMDGIEEGQGDTAAVEVEETKEEEGELGDEQEVVIIQDTGFTIKIQTPGLDPFELPVN